MFPTVRLRKLDPQQAFWDFARACPVEVKSTLAELADRDYVVVGPAEADRVLTHLQDAYGFGDDDVGPSFRMPVTLEKL